MNRNCERFFSVMLILTIKRFLHKINFHFKLLLWAFVIRRAYLLKRLVDILASTILLIFLIPLFSIVALGIHIESPGHIFFKQTSITCLWQISGRSDIPFPQQVELYLQYIESHFFWAYIKILLKTLPAILMGKG